MGVSSRRLGNSTSTQLAHYGRGEKTRRPYCRTTPRYQRHTSLARFEGENIPGEHVDGVSTLMYEQVLPSGPSPSSPVPRVPSVPRIAKKVAHLFCFPCYLPTPLHTAPLFGRRDIRHASVTGPQTWVSVLESGLVWSTTYTHRTIAESRCRAA